MSALPCPVSNPFAAADQYYAKIAGFLGSEEARQVKHSELERQLEGMGRELLRKLLQAHLDMRGSGKAVEPVRDAAGTTLTPTPVHERSLESIFGEVEVARTGYRATGTPSLHPLDGALNLPPEKYSLEVRRRVAIEAAKSSFDEGVKTLEVYTGAHVPKRQFEELVMRAAQDFEAFYTKRQTGARAGPQTGSILVSNSSLPRLLGRQERWSRFSSSVAANGLGEVVQSATLLPKAGLRNGQQSRYRDFSARAAIAKHHLPPLHGDA